MIPFRSVTHWGPPWSRSIEFLFSSFNCPEYVSSSRNDKQGVQRGRTQNIISLFPFFLFFFFVFSAIEPFFYPRLLDSRDKQSTLSSYRDLLFPCAKRGKETWLLVVYARHTLDQILSANFVTIDIDSTMDLCNVKSSFDSFARKKIVFSQMHDILSSSCNQNRTEAMINPYLIETVRFNIYELLRIIVINIFFFWYIVLFKFFRQMFEIKK